MPEAVTPEAFEKLKLRVYGLADKVQNVMVEHARIGGRIDSAEQSIDRLRQSSATSEQVISSSTILALKLDHLLEKQGDLKRHVTWSGRLTMLLFVGVVIAAVWVVLR